MTHLSDASGDQDQILDRALARLRAAQGVEGRGDGRQDGGGVLLLHGALGVGISHRLNLFAMQAGAEFLVLRAAGEAHRPEPYRVWREVVNHAQAYPAEVVGARVRDEHEKPVSARLVLRNLARALRHTNTASIIIIDHWERVDRGSRRVLKLIEQEITLRNVLIVIAGDHSIIPATIRHPLGANAWTQGRLVSQLVSGPEPAAIAALISRRYPGAATAVVTAATKVLITQCGHNFASIMIALRSLEAEHAADDVLTQLVSGSMARSLGGSFQSEEEAPTHAEEPSVIGRPRQMIARLVGSLTEVEREVLSIWLLGARYSRAEICAIADLKERDLEAAIHAAYRCGLIPSVWVSAVEVHPLVVDAVMSGVGSGVLQRTHKILGDRERNQDQLFAALRHYLAAGPELSHAALLEVLREAWRDAHRWRDHDLIAQFGALITQLEADPTGSDPELLTTEQKLVSEMADAVGQLVTALREVNLREFNHHLEAATEIADRADEDSLVAWSWNLQAVSALIEADEAKLAHCRQMVERYGPHLAHWPQIAAAQLGGEWSQVPIAPEDPVLNAFIEMGTFTEIGKALPVSVDEALGADVDLFWLTLAAQVVVCVGDRARARNAAERLEPYVDEIAVHPEGLMVLGPVASTLAELHFVLELDDGDGADSRPAASRRSEALRAIAARIAQEMNSPWMTSSVAEAAQRSVTAGRGLSDRELKVASMLAQGLTNAEMAKDLSYSPSTIRRCIANLGTVVGTSSRKDLIKRLREFGFVDNEARA